MAGSVAVPSGLASQQTPTRGRAGRWRTPEPGRLLARGAAVLLADLGWAVLHELPLGNRRRVDLAAIDARGRIAIVEVKSSLADWRADAKWPEYLPWCDLFYFAVPEDFPRPVLDEAAARPAIAGLMVVDGFSGAIVRPAAERPLPAARRRALTLRFARAAAGRLARRDSGFSLRLADD
ncbi:MAG: DNA repair protein MmcB-related protein [Alphaproteobacteria bacterium]|nr:MAG: DNA repair protein MmcB-related protein [Alphaproteobacteria bacterium]